VKKKIFIALICSLCITNIPMLGSYEFGSGVVYAAETFDYSAIFDANFYAANNSDVAIAYGNDAILMYNHFITTGMYEGRQPSASFNVQIYMSNYDDLRAAYGSDIASYYKHYITLGMSEGRVANTLLDGKTLLSFDELSSSNDSSSNDASSSDSSVDLSAWNLILVNHYNGLSTDYVPDVTLVANGQYMHVNVAGIVKQMIADAKSEGVNLTLVSGYRSASRQTYLYNRKVNYYVGLGYSKSEALTKAASVVNPPGYSEHQTGLCMDITDSSYVSLTENQENTKGYKWLYANCYKYGFILRYPKDKENITEVIYEPWHFRYVGVEAATYIMSNNLTLEEYIAMNS